MYPSSRRKKSSIPKNFPPNISLQSTENIDFDGRIVAIRLCTAPLWKTLLRYLSYLLSGFILYLLNLWIPSLFIKMALTEESEPEQATHIILYGAGNYFTWFEVLSFKDNHIEVAPLIQEHTANKTLKVFHYRLFKYYLEEETLTFKPCLFNLNNHTWSQIHDQFLHGLDEKQVNDHTIQYGENMTDIPKKSCLTLLIEEIITPFYIFQVYSFIIWYIDYYYIYTYILIFMTVISVGITLYQTMQTRTKLQQLSHYEIGVKVHRRVVGELTPIMISSAQLVPGDLMEIPEGVSMPCDALLLRGSCIMNEAMLTGESIPVSKHPLPCSDVFHNPKDDRQHILFSGTKCIYTRHYEEGPALALVISTGFDTLKGGLVRTMLFPKKLDVGFQTDSYKFIFGLAIMGILAFIIDLGSFTDIPEGASLIGTIIIKGSELLTVSIPPALPTCIQIGISVALAKLNKHRIFCISPNKINDAGRVNIMCFDKTGTLTEENLDLLGVRPVDNNPSKKGLNFFQHALDSPKIGFADLVSDISKAMADISLEHQPITHVDNSVAHENKNNSLLQILEIMASCHSLTLNQNQLLGDPLDIKMFEATGWTLEMNEYQRYDKSIAAVVKPPVQHEKSFTHNKGLAIYRQFEFSSKLQRMSVVLKAFDDKEFQVHIKGSPEKIKELCKAETVPENFHSALQEHTQNGYRVLACATRTLLLNERQIVGMKREEAERDFTFVGFLVMENKLKPPTTEIIDVLHSADIKSIMVTGDDALTALSIARQCHIIGNQRKIYLGDISAKSLPGKDIISWKDFDLLRQAVHRQTEIQERRSSFIAPNEFVAFEKDHIPSPELEHASILIDNEEPKHNLRLMSNRDSVALASPKVPLKSQDQEQHHQGGIPSYNFVDLEDFSSSLSDYENCCFAITGKAFSLIVHEAEAKKNQQYRSLLHLLLKKCLVFARMNPDEKELLVKLLIAQKGNIIGMCGDGANDVRALKAAHVGISLSEAEASIAAPFTSNIQDITCVPRLLREGRAALVTSYQAFKYMILFAVIFTISLGTIYHYVIEAPDWQYYHFEIFIVLPLSTTMTMSKTSDYLSKQRPTGRLISVEILSSVIGQGIIQAAFIIGTYALMMAQPWYDRSLCKDSFDSFAACTENTTLYILTIFQYTMTAWVFLAGKPFKKPFYTNYWFTFSLIPIMIVNYLVAYNPFNWQFFYTASWAVEVELPMSWRRTLMEIIIVNSVLTVVWEKVGVGLVTKAWKRYQEKGSGKQGPELYVSLLNIK